MTAKEYLRQIRKLEGYIWSLIEQRDTLRQQAEGGGNRMSSNPKTAMQGDRMSGKIARIVDVDSSIDALIQEQLKLKKEAIQKIHGLSQLDHKTLLILRYVNFEEWDSITQKMGFSERQIFYLHGKALQNFEDKYLK